MRSNLKQFFCRLSLTILVTLGYNVRLPAHDLPADRSRLDTVTANCFNSSSTSAEHHPSLPIHPDNTDDTKVVPSAAGWSRQVMLHCIVRQASPALAAWSNQPQLWHELVGKRLSQQNFFLSTLWCRAKFEQAAARSQANHEIVINVPDVGTAPHPIEKMPPKFSEQIAAARLSEVYMPYDFHLSDWRFGQFPYHGKSITAPFPAKAPSFSNHFRGPTWQCRELGEFLLKIERWQCSTYSTLSHGDSFARSANKLITSMVDLADSGRRALQTANSQSTLATPQTETGGIDLLGPQFVVYDSTFGGSIVLTIAQARQWQFEIPKAQNRLSSLLGAAFQPLQSSARAAASSQLEAAGQSLLKLSKLLSTTQEPKVASRPSAKHN